MRGRVIPRERNHQPTGYPQYSNRGGPSTHYARKHNYVYYPADWTDSASGASYRKGYYDENGAYYERVVFRKDGVYKDVPCTCEFCGVTAMYTFSSGEALVCRQCGAPLRIEAILDEYTQDPEYTAYEIRYPESKIKSSGGDGTGKAAKRGFLLAFFGVILLLLLLPSLAGSCGSGRTRDDTLYALPSEPMVYEDPVKTNLEIFGDTLYLDQTEAGYILSPDGGESWDRKLTWDYGQDSYYDRQAECWIWYNTEVSPNLWQYWYEGISSEYGEYGWMEYEPEGWFIEVDDGKWAPLPEHFVSERLWHMEIDPELG